MKIILDRFRLAVFAAVMFILLHGVSCSVNGDGAMPLLEKADSLMAEDPQAALDVLASVANGTDAGMDRHERAYFLLLRTEAEYRCGMPLSRDTAVRGTAEYFSGRGEKRLYARALMMQGAVYQEMACAVLGYGCCRKDLPETGKAVALLRDTLGLAAGRIAKGLDVARSLGDRETMLVGYELMTRQYNLQEEYGRTLDCVREAVAECGVAFNWESSRNILDMIFLNQAEAYALSGHADSAGMVLDGIGPLPGLEGSMRLCRVRQALAVSEEDWDAVEAEQEVLDSLSALADSTVYEKELHIMELMLENEELRVQATNGRDLMLTVLAVLAAAVFIAVAVYIVLQARIRKLRRENSELKESIGTFDPAAVRAEAPGSSESTEAGAGIDGVLRDMVSLVGEMNEMCNRAEDTSCDGIRKMLDRYFPEKEIYERICRICDILYPDVLSRIAMEHPSLTRNDILLIALMACGFPTGAICAIRRLNVHSLNVQKTRTARKIAPGLRLSDFVSRNFPRN